VLFFSQQLNLQTKHNRRKAPLFTTKKPAACVHGALCTRYKIPQGILAVLLDKTNFKDYAGAKRAPSRLCTPSSNKPPLCTSQKQSTIGEKSRKRLL